MSAGRVLILDDDPAILEGMTMALEMVDLEVFSTTSVFELPFLVGRHDPDVVLVDLSMPALTGERALTIARQRMRTDARFIIFSGRAPDELAELTEETGAHGFVAKIDEMSQILRRITYWVRERRALQEAS